MRPVVQRFRRFFAESVPFDWDILRTLSAEPVPYHLSYWWWCLGGTPLYLFSVQVATGILLTFYYVPDPSHAYESVVHITQEVRFGWYLRSLHKWAANLMIVAVFLHLLRVFSTRLLFSGRTRLRCCSTMPLLEKSGVFEA